MKKILEVIFLVAVPAFALAQRPGATYDGLKYDKTSETRIAAVIEQVQEFECPVSAAFGHHVIVKTISGPMVVHTAPVKFLQHYGIELKAGDKISVLGSKLKDGAKRDTMLAREIARDTDVFIFRDQQGKPLW